MTQTFGAKMRNLRYIRRGERLGSIILYHGTTHRLRDIILSEGLLPRNKSGMPSNSEEAKSQEDLVYLAVESVARDAYTAYAQEVYGGRGLVVAVNVSIKNLVPDEDSKKKTWQESLLAIGTCAHRGVILPSSIVNMYEEGRVTFPSCSPEILKKMQALFDRKASIGEFRELAKPYENQL